MRPILTLQVLLDLGAKFIKVSTTLVMLAGSVVNDGVDLLEKGTRQSGINNR